MNIRQENKFTMEDYASADIDMDINLFDLFTFCDLSPKLIDIMIGIKSNPDIKIIEEVIVARYTNSETTRNFIILAWLHEVIAKHPEFMFELANPLLIEQAAKFVDDMDATISNYETCKYISRRSITGAEIKKEIQLNANNLYILCIGFRYCISGNREILESIRGRTHSRGVFSAMIYLIGPELTKEIMGGSAYLTLYNI